MTLKNDALSSLGELLITGFQGFELSDETARFLRESRIGGVILFTPNYESPGQICELTNEIQECRTDLPLWVSVDHEGGRVQRFRKGFGRIPDAAAIGALNSPKLAFDIAEITASELKAVGVNLNFTPVADILTNPKNPVIGNRAFGSDEDLVSKMATAVVRGHLVAGVQPCVKHFPGHGDTSTDSHYALPKVDTPLETLINREFIPFLKCFKSKCSMVMTAHVLVTQVDSKYPATLSPLFLKKILREELRYQKVIISDDLEMKAIADHYGAEEAPRLALEAGCDLLIYRSEAASRMAYESLVKAVESGELEAEVVLEAVQRTRSLKKEALSHYQPVSVADVGRKLCRSESIELLSQFEDKGRRT